MCPVNGQWSVAGHFSGSMLVWWSVGLFCEPVGPQKLQNYAVFTDFFGFAAGSIIRRCSSNASAVPSPSIQGQACGVLGWHPSFYWVVLALDRNDKLKALNPTALRNLSTLNPNPEPRILSPETP